MDARPFATVSLAIP
jgi:hypothetical protein